MLAKFDKLIFRLAQKVKMSATPVPGFILGMSGTDSIITFLLLSEVAIREGFGVVGIHYVTDEHPQTFFTREMVPWLQARYPVKNISVGSKLVPNIRVGSKLAKLDNSDQYRWAELHARTVNPGNSFRYWTANTVNATEKALGTFGIMANSASIAPIISLYKSEILELCEEFGVPKGAMDRSRIPDCICGRDEFAAENIELIDEILRNNLTKDYPADVLRKAMDYIRDTKRANDFKNRTPYNV